MKITAIICLFSFLYISCGDASNNKKDAKQDVRQEIIGMNEQEYWKIIDFSAKEALGNEEVQIEFIHDQLMKYSADDIIKFMLIQSQLMNESDHYNILYPYLIINGMPAYSDNGYIVGDDGYSYFRLWLMHQGEMVFKETLKNPDFLAEIIKPMDEPYYEMIAAVAMEAYFDKAGVEELPESYLNNIHFDGLIKGTRYQITELPNKFPKLWAKFMSNK